MKQDQSECPLRPQQKKSLRYLLILVLNSVLFFAVYRVLLIYASMTDRTLGAFVTMIFYLVLLLGFTLAYLIYNRFLYRKGITPEQLPDDWSDEQKAEFIADGERRLEKSKWLMLIIFPLLLTFCLDAVDLFILDIFR